MTKYDPFERGPHPVGARAFAWRDETRDRTLPVEVWYPASEAHRGQDLDDATRDRYQPLPIAPEVTQDAVRDAEAQPGRFPLVVFSHGFGGERRQSTHFTTHLASHGYVVVAMDHVGNTTADMMEMASAAPEPDLISRFMSDRPTDASFVIDCMLQGDAGLGVDPERIGISGHSFGGWTTLMTTGADARIRAALPLAPAGGDTPLTPPGFANDMRDAIDMGWERPVPTLYLTAEFDTLLPLDGMRELLARTPEPRKGVVLLRSDHFHFCDRAEETHDMFKVMGPMMAGAAGEGAPDMTGLFASMKASSELCPGAHGYAMTCGLGLAHMDAHLRGVADAAALLDEDLVQVMASRGIEVGPL